MSLPDRIGRHQIREQIGAGGFATVWRGYDAELDDDVAVKILAENWVARADIRDRFTEEARILRRADSDRVVRVHDIGTLDDGRPYFVMTYADGGTLADRLARRQLPVPDALRLIEESARCVAELHEIGILHRDVKPSNLLFRSTAAGRERVMIADLGVAKALANASGLTSVTGSPGYMAPEQATYGGNLDTRADVYSLGVVAYEILTGTLPTRGSSVPPSSLRPDVDAGIDEVVMRALAHDRQHRYPDAAAFASAIGLLRARSTPPAPGSVPPGPVRPGPAPHLPHWAPSPAPLPAPVVHGPPAGIVVSSVPWTPPASRVQQRPRPRAPKTVVAASVLTFLGVGPLLVFAGLFLLALTSSVGDDTDVRLIGNLSDDTVYVLGAVIFLAMSVASILFGLRALWGHNGARIALTALGVLNIAFDIFVTIRGVTWFVVGAVYIALALALFWVGGANAWYRRTK